tara:strand:+ start:499 stop:654 length:156 start_codon:yes stop_codon:yes gene_type:complete
MNKIPPLDFPLYLTTVPLLARGEGGCFISNKNNLSQDEMVEQVENSDFYEG